MNRSTEMPFAEFWARYLVHHRRPATRAFHSAGSLVCLLGLALAVALRSPWPLWVAASLGYFCAFAGHWWVERNQPLTFSSPIRAAICNWLLFGVELRGLFGAPGFNRTLARALVLAPIAISGCSDIGGQ